jgi:predicted metal-dependent hydrolase
MPNDVLIPGSPCGWPPPVRLRVSARARHVRIAVSPRDGLVLVIPLGVAPSRYLEFLAARREWIERHLARRLEMYPECAAADSGGPVKPPEVLEFRAVAERVAVDYLCGRGRPRLRENGGGRIMVVTGEGGAEGGAGLRTLLSGYVKKAGARVLPGMLAEAAGQTGLSFASCSVGFAARRWGSCTAKGAIRLSAKLLFLPPHLARHVMLHELAHLRHLNHSGAFYKVLETLDPHWRGHNRELVQAQSYLPVIFW